MKISQFQSCSFATSSAAKPQGRLAAPIHQPWPLDAMCFSGFRLAVAATGPSCTFISVIDVPRFELLEREISGDFFSPNCQIFFSCVMKGSTFYMAHFWGNLRGMWGICGILRWIRAWKSIAWSFPEITCLGASAIFYFHWKVGGWGTSWRSSTIETPEDWKTVRI